MTSLQLHLLKRCGLAGLTLFYALSLAVMPAHGHVAQQSEEGIDVEVPEEPQSGGTDFPDCFFCQVVTTAAHPAFAPHFAFGSAMSELDMAAHMLDPTQQNRPRPKARAPPTL